MNFFFTRFSLKFSSESLCISISFFLFGNVCVNAAIWLRKLLYRFRAARYQNFSVRYVEWIISRVRRANLMWNTGDALRTMMQERARIQRYASVFIWSLITRRVLSPSITFRPRDHVLSRAEPYGAMPYVRAPSYSGLWVIEPGVIVAGKTRRATAPWWTPWISTVNPITAIASR